MKHRRPRPVRALWWWLLHRTGLDLVAADIDLMCATFPRRPV